MNRNKIARACKQEFSSVDLIKFSCLNVNNLQKMSALYSFQVLGFYFDMKKKGMKKKRHSF